VFGEVSRTIALEKSIEENMARQWMACLKAGQGTTDAFFWFQLKRPCIFIQQ